DGVARLGEPGRDGFDADRSAAEIACNHRQMPAVERVEAEPIDLQPGQRLGGDPAIDMTVAGDAGKIAHPAQQPAGDAWRATRPPGDLQRAIVTKRHRENPGAAAHDLLQLLARV